MTAVKTGIELIAEERSRQITEEGWTPEHDDEHDSGELAMAAACYASTCPLYEARGRIGNRIVTFVDPWPWDRKSDTRGDDGPIRDLQKAGALIAAEIDRIQRKSKKEQRT